MTYPIENHLYQKTIGISSPLCSYTNMSDKSSRSNREQSNIAIAPQIFCLLEASIIFSLTVAAIPVFV